MNEPSTETTGWPPLPAKMMLDAEIAQEIETLGAAWDDYRAGDCDHGGSPGEWMVERLDELETEQKRRASA